MRTFLAGLFKRTLALLIAWALLLFLVLLTLGVLISGARAPVPEVEKGSVLVLDLARTITDTPRQLEPLEALEELFDPDDTPDIHLRALLDALDRASRDDRIAGLYIRGSLLTENGGSGYATLREVRSAIRAFRESGKPTVAAFRLGTQRDYYLMSAAGTVLIHPETVLPLHGLMVESPFFPELMEKAGIGVQAVQAGSYKGARDPFTETAFSRPVREQLSRLVGDLWETIKGDIASARGMEDAQIQKIADADGLLEPAQALGYDLVDDIVFDDGVLSQLKTFGRTGSDGKLKRIGVHDYRAEQQSVVEREASSSPRVVVAYAEGEILPGETYGRGAIGGDWLSRRLRELRSDEDVAAVVLRVNSPGGSVYASELIRRELALLREAGKPVVVSMGSMATSGGYWIATASDTILADRATITGSIGVIGMLFNIEGSSEKLGIAWDSVKATAQADLFSIARPLRPEQLARFEAIIEGTYDDFTRHVARSRDLDDEAVAAVAEGRLWTGNDAVRVNLADQTGDLRDAIQKAVQLAGLGADYQVRDLPEEETAASLFSEEPEETVARAVRARLGTGHLGQTVERLVRVAADYAAHPDPRHAYARTPYFLEVR
ncbi:MAG: signal peptide peptidase SppA [Opitutales bacterium]